MSQQAALDYLPDDLSDEAKRRLLALAEESEPEPAPLAVNEHLIRHWCETTEDGNPLYLDHAYAASQGHPSVVAPPGSIMTTFTMPYRWPWPPEGREPTPHIHYLIKELLNLPVGIITEIDVEQHAPVHIGDTISVSQRLVSISPWKKTRLGEGHFWTMERFYRIQDGRIQRGRNQRGELAIRERMVGFGYGRERGPASTATAGGGWSPAVEEMIRGEETGYQPPQYRDRFWEDVDEGQQLPELLMPITVTRCVYLASATRDFSPQHSNRDYAQERSQAKDIFVNTPFNIGMLSRFMTDWGGPRSIVRRMKFAMRGNVCAGDIMRITGAVTRKYIEDNEHRVDLDIVIHTEDGPITPSTGTLALPSREAGA